jgi:EAL and modified HD-GYP domain-containing signal transduction protein
MIGRQPILDRRRRVLGYELVFNLDGPVATEVAPGTAAAHVVADGILSFGLDRLVGPRRAFIEIPPAWLSHEVISVLPASRVVIAIPADGPIDAEAVEACTRLKTAGYMLALKRFAPGSDAAPLLPLADYITHDFVATEPAAAQACLDSRKHLTRQPAAIATGVETAEAFNEALKQGFSHAQGYFFARDTDIESKAVPHGHVGSLRLLSALNDANLSLDDLEDTLKHDAALCYRMLRTVNSAGFAQTREITSIRHALLLLGRDIIRRWATLWVLADLGTGAHSELVTMASIRGRFCEIISARRGGTDAGGEGFLLGMCSCLEAMLQRPMASILEDLPMSPELTAALLGHDNASRRLLDCIIAYERGDWTTALTLAGGLGISLTWLPPAHAQALDWAIDARRIDSSNTKH